MNFIKGQLNPRRVVFLFIPFALVLFYLMFMAVEKYRSESSYIIRDLSAKENFGVDLGIFGTSASSQQQDASIVVEYLRSMGMLKKLDSRFELRKRYSNGETDILDRLLSSSTEEDFLDLYRKHLKIVPDELSGITHIAFDSSSPKLARQILAFLVKEGEAFLNHLNHQRAQKKMAFATSQLEQNRATLDQAIERLEKFQDQHRLVDPSADVAVQNSIIANLEASIVEKTAEYNQLLSYMAPDTIEVLKLEKNIQELKAALNNTKAKLSGTQSARLNELLFEYERLKSEVDFATEVYKNTLVQYEVSKIEALQESKIFEVIAAPNLPDGFVYPERFKILFLAAILLAGIYKIAGLFHAVIKDHKD